MDLQSLVAQWLAENQPDIKIDKGVICVPIISEHAKDDDVWYVCRIDEDRVRLFNPGIKKFGPDVMAGLPTFFEQLNAIIEYYRTYAP